MSYMDALWIKIVNSYSKWPSLAHTQSSSLCGHSSIGFRNTTIGKSALPSEETALNFQYWDISTCKPSPEAWITICSPRGLGLDLQKINLKWRWSPEQLSPATAGLPVSCVLGLSPAGSSSPVHGRRCCKKRHPIIESLKQSLRKAAADYPVDVLHNSIDGWPQDLRTLCALMVAILIHNASM